jgi:hypothetical protein
MAQNNRGLLYAIGALFFLLAAAGCSKSNTANTSSQGTLSATIGTTNFSALTTYGAYYSNVHQMGVVSILPQGRDSTIFEMEFPYPPPINHPFSSDSTTCNFSYFTRSGSMNYNANTGSGHAILTITRIDSVGHQITGTFSGTLVNASNSKDSLVITGGKFGTIYTPE